ncbi:hypothetical protein ACFV6F_32920 [Kitasatospora phosalacinea]|uniref:hypothetical protein n=1 Tax=Kitasatospora phosalacinea TaxID=2065 RepID=UPI00364991C4
MSGDGYIRWYRERIGPGGFIEQVKYFGELGLHALQPERGVLMVDVDGEEIPVGIEEADRILSLHLGDVASIWRFAEDAQVVCTYSDPSAGFGTQTFSLGSLLAEEVEQIESVLVRAAEEFPVGTSALVVDRRGVSDPDAWDSQILYGGRDAPGHADLVLTREPVTSKLLAAPAGFRGADVGSGWTRVSLC